MEKLLFRKLSALYLSKQPHYMDRLKKKQAVALNNFTINLKKSTSSYNPVPSLNISIANVSKEGEGYFLKAKLTDNSVTPENTEWCKMQQEQHGSKPVEAQRARDVIPDGPFLSK